MKLLIEIPEKMYHMINAGFYDYGDMNVIIQNSISLDEIRAELHATAEMHEDGNYYLREEWIDEIINKYREVENESTRSRRTHG